MNRIHLDRFDLNLLTVLRAVLAEGSVTRAAARLSLTQSAVSHALRRLREQTGDALFVRRGATLAPTPFTRQLAGPMQQAMRGLEDALNTATGFDPALSVRRFVVGMDDRVELFALPGLARTLYDAGPALTFDSVRVPSTEVVSALAGGALDAVVSASDLQHATLRRVTVAVDPLAVVVRTGHPKVRGERLSLRQYLDAEHVAVVDPSNPGGDVDTALERAGYSRRIRFRMQRYIAAVEIVTRTDLLLTMPRSYAHQINARAGNRLLPLPFRLPALRYHLYWNVNADADPGARWLRGAIRRTLKARQGGA